jgi:hypothetical protein
MNSINPDPVRKDERGSSLLSKSSSRKDFASGSGLP